MHSNNRGPIDRTSPIQDVQERTPKKEDPETGFCQCGCGQLVPFAKQNGRGLVKGQPVRFLRGHQRRSGRIDAYGRECITCGSYKPWAEFYTLARGGVQGHMCDCKPCRRENVRLTRDPEKRKTVARQWRTANPERYQEGQVRQAAKIRGLDPDMIIGHLREHSGLCDICGGRADSGDQRNSRLCIDHDHRTGEFRGLLCSSCNIGIGKFRDDVAILKAAMEYLLRARRSKEEAA